MRTQRHFVYTFLAILACSLPLSCALTACDNQQSSYEKLGYHTPGYEFDDIEQNNNNLDINIPSEKKHLELINEARGKFVSAQFDDSKHLPVRYSYKLPENYQEDKTYPLVIALPGLDAMWHGDDYRDENLLEPIVTAWDNAGEELIVASAQLEDWGENGSRQAIELTQKLLADLPVDRSRVYVTGFSSGGEIWTQAITLHPELFTAYLQISAQWDGRMAQTCKARIPIYFLVGENDSFYGSDETRRIYHQMYDIYVEQGLSSSEINELLQLNVLDDSFFDARELDYHGGAQEALLRFPEISAWLLSRHKSTPPTSATPTTPPTQPNPTTSNAN